MFFTPLLQGAAALAQTQAAGVHPLKTPWTRQPQGPVEIDWSNPITRGLVVETGGHRYHGTRLIDGTVNQSTTTGGGVSLAHTRYGKALSFNGTQLSGAASFGDVDRGDGYTQASWQVIWKSGAGKLFSKWSGTGSEQSWLIQLPASGSGADLTWVVATSGGFTWFRALGVFSTTDWNSAVFIWRGGNTTGAALSLIVNGVDRSSSLTSLGTGGTVQATGAGLLQIGHGGDGDPITGQVAIARMWKRGLSVAEALVLSANPWQIFKPTRRLLGTIARTQGTTGVHPLRTRQTRQPQASAQIDWSNPLTRGLAWAGFPGSGVVTKQGTVGQEAWPAGKSWRFSGVSASRVNTGFTPPTTGPCTLIVLVDALSLFSANPVFAIGDRCTISITATGFQFFTWNGTVWQSISITTQVDDGPAVVIGRHTGSTNFINYHVISGSGFGRKISTSIACAPRTHTTALQLTIGGEVENTARTSNCRVFMGAFLNRAISDGEVAAISANPWQLFKPTRRLLGTATAVSSATISRPGSDIVVAGWSASTGPDLYAMIDEAVADDADYIVSPDLGGTPGPATFGSTISLAAGSYDISIRARRTSTAGEVRVLMKDAGGVTVGTSAWQALGSAFTTYSLSVTTTGTATQLSIEVQQ